MSRAKFKVLDATYEGTPSGDVLVTFVLSKESIQDWHNLVNPLPDAGELRRAIELILWRAQNKSWISCREDDEI